MEFPDSKVRVDPIFYSEHHIIDKLPKPAALLLRMIRPNTDAANEAAIDQLIINDFWEWDELIRLARKHGSIPLIYRSLKHRPESMVPADILAQVRQDFQRIGLMINLQVQVMKEVIERFNDAGVPLLFFKGLPLGQQAYGNAIWRKPGDLDILIQKPHIETAKKLLVEMGLETRLDRAAEKEQLERQDQLTFYGNTADVDLHLSLQQRSFLKMSYAATFDRENVWRRVTHVMMDGIQVPCLSPEDQFCLIAVHSAKHGWHWLYMLVDIASAMVNMNLNWLKVISLAKRIKAERMLGLNVLLVNQLFELSIPTHLVPLVNNDTSLRPLANQILTRIFDEEANDKPLQFHRIQAGLFPRWSEKAKYLGFVTAQHWKRKKEEKGSGD